MSVDDDFSNGSSLHPVYFELDRDCLDSLQSEVTLLWLLLYVQIAVYLIQYLALLSLLIVSLLQQYISYNQKPIIAT